MKIFVGYEEVQDIAYKVLEYSILKNSSRTVDVSPLKQSDLNIPGWNPPQDPLASTEFTYTRFLIPYLCGYQGTALYLDCDFLCLSDIGDLFHLETGPYALRVVKHDYKPQSVIKMGDKIQTSYPRKNWSSLMLMNCEKLRTWTPEKINRSPASWLHRFEGIPDELIGEIETEWNQLDSRSSNTKMIHYTSGGPWLRGCESHPEAELWNEYKKEMQRRSC